MNPDTRHLELMHRQGAALKELFGPPMTIGDLTQAETRPVARQVGEPGKQNWTTFTLGEVVEVATVSGVVTLIVANLHTLGILLKGGRLKTLGRLEAGMPITVKGEACEVVKVSSKGLYVRGA